MDENIIRQIQEADNNGMEYAEVLIPVSDSNTWPIDILYAGDRIAVTLFRHDIISHQIHVVLVPDESVNKKYGIGFKTMP